MTWRERIATAPEACSAEHEEFTKLATDWSSCAVGELEGIPRTFYDTPIDDNLYILAIDFVKAVEIADWPIAEVVLNRIETRAEEVRNEQLRIADAPH